MYISAITRTELQVPPDVHLGTLTIASVAVGAIEIC